MARYLYSELASAIDARKRCIETNNDWAEKWSAAIKNAEDNFLPHGSGVDSGCKIDLERSHGGKLVIDLGYHHMNDVGYYDGWTEHTAYVTPSFDGINIRITGSNRGDIKDYLYETLEYALTQRVNLLPLGDKADAHIESRKASLESTLLTWATDNLPAQPNAEYYERYWSKEQAEVVIASVEFWLREAAK